MDPWANRACKEEGKEEQREGSKKGGKEGGKGRGKEGRRKENLVKLFWWVLIKTPNT